MPDLEPTTDYVRLAGLVVDSDLMDPLCGRLGVRSLGDFQSYAAEDMGDLVDDVADNPELQNILAEPVDWFDPAEALSAVRALQPHFVAERFIDPRGGRRRVNGKWVDEAVDATDALLAELRDVDRVLGVAVDRGVRFRFHVGF